MRVDRPGWSKQKIAGRISGCGVAGRQHHPVGVELEMRHLARRQQAVVKFGRLLGQRELERRFGNPKSFECAPGQRNT
jgi:hypothetical protein